LLSLQSVQELDQMRYNTETIYSTCKIKLSTSTAMLVGGHEGQSACTKYNFNNLRRFPTRHLWHRAAAVGKPGQRLLNGSLSTY